MDDSQTHRTIEQLVAEEHRLWEARDESVVENHEQER